MREAVSTSDCPHEVHADRLGLAGILRSGAIEVSLYMGDGSF